MAVLTDLVIYQLLKKKNTLITTPWIQDIISDGHSNKVNLLSFLLDSLISFPSQAVLPPGSPGIHSERTILAAL